MNLKELGKLIGALAVIFTFGLTHVNSKAIVPRDEAQINETLSLIQNGDEISRRQTITEDKVLPDALDLPPGRCPTTPCQLGTTCDPSGICVPCSAWVGAYDVPADCIDFISISKPVPVKNEEELNSPPNKCTQESDCDLGKWCVHTGTCESCEVLKSMPDVYQAECSRTVNAQQGKKLHKTFAISVSTGAILLTLLFVGFFCLGKKIRIRQHGYPVEENDDIAETEMDKLNVEEGADVPESVGEAYPIAVADTSVGRSATTG